MAGETTPTETAINIQHYESIVKDEAPADCRTT